MDEIKQDLLGKIYEVMKDDSKAINNNQFFYVRVLQVRNAKHTLCWNNKLKINKKMR